MTQAQPSPNQLKKTSQLNPLDAPTAQPAKIRPPLAFTTPNSLCRVLLNLDAFRSVRVEVHSQLSIGRSDFSEGFVPGLDMTPYGATDAGISRRHAMLFIAENKLYIRDLSSTNGTKVNGEMLIPNEPHPVKEGDELEFGHLRVRIDSLSFGR